MAAVRAAPRQSNAPAKTTASESAWSRVAAVGDMTCPSCSMATTATTLAFRSNSSRCRGQPTPALSLRSTPNQGATA
jgi:hypothetical protein